MRTVRQLITDTRKWKSLVGTDLERNAKQVMLYNWQVIESMDIDGDIFRDITVKARSNRSKEKGGKPNYGPEHTVEMRLYGTEEYDTKAWVSCSCEYFKFTCEVALYNKDASDIVYSNGEDPNIRNPSQIPIMCKHLLQAFRSGAVKRPVTKSLVKKQLEIEKKEKEEKEKKRLKKEKEREQQKLKKEKEREREKEKVKKEREKTREKVIKEREKAKEKIMREKEREKIARERDLDKIKRDKEREARQRQIEKTRKEREKKR